MLTVSPACGMPLCWAPLPEPSQDRASSQPREVQAHLLSPTQPSRSGRGRLFVSQGLPCLSQKQAGFLQARLGEPTVTEMAVFQGQLAALGVHPGCQQRGILVRNLSPGPQASCLHFLGHLSLVGGRHQRVGSRRGEGPTVIQCGVESSPPPGLKHLPETALPAPQVLQGLLQPQHFLGCCHWPCPTDPGWSRC